jgi:uncharacterized repeat protein (TIGR04076 family)
MDRKDFLKKTGCGALCFTAAPAVLASTAFKADQDLPERKRYKIDIEIFEAREDTWCHKKGDKFKYPDDQGKICPWLWQSMNDFVKVLAHGATLSWKYEGTPYEKVIDPDGVTTEYIRCPDPTADLVAKITRTKVDA